MFNNAKFIGGWGFKVLHRLFWWCVDRKVSVEPMHVYF